MCPRAQKAFCLSLSTLPGCSAYAGKDETVTLPATNEWGTTNESITAAGAKAQKELATLKQSAAQCCSSDPSTCPPAASDAADASNTKATPDAGIAGGGATLAKAAGSGGKAEAIAAGVCKGRKEVCRYQALKYKDDLKSVNCSNCSAQSSVSSQLDQAAQACAKLDDTSLQAKSETDYQASDSSTTTKQTASGQQGSGSGGNSMGQLASVLPALMSAMEAQQNANSDATNPTTNPTTDPSQNAAAQPDCSNPAVVAAAGVCPATTTAPTAWNPNSGQAGLNAPAAGGQLNTGNLGDNMIGAPEASQFGQPIQPTAQATTPIGSGGGGGFNGGSSSGSASLGSPTKASAGRGMDTDILARNASGASQFTQGYGGDASPVTSGSGYSAPPPQEMADLSRFLPKLNSNVLRGLAGGNAQVVQINSKDVNIWNRISDRIKSRCSQGLLRDCIP